MFLNGEQHIGHHMRSYEDIAGYFFGKGVLEVSDTETIRTQLGGRRRCDLCYWRICLFPLYQVMLTQAATQKTE